MVDLAGIAIEPVPILVSGTVQGVVLALAGRRHGNRGELRGRIVRLVTVGIGSIDIVEDVSANSCAVAVHFQEIAAIDGRGKQQIVIVTNAVVVIPVQLGGAIALVEEDPRVRVSFGVEVVDPAGVGIESIPVLVCFAVDRVVLALERLPYRDVGVVCIGIVRLVSIGIGAVAVIELVVACRSAETDHFQFVIRVGRKRVLEVEVEAVAIVIVPFQQGGSVVLIQIDLGVGVVGRIECVVTARVGVEPVPVLIGVAVQGMVLSLVVRGGRNIGVICGRVVRLVTVRRGYIMEVEVIDSNRSVVADHFQFVKSCCGGRVTQHVVVTVAALVVRSDQRGAVVLIEINDVVGVAGGPESVGHAGNSVEPVPILVAAVVQRVDLVSVVGIDCYRRIIGCGIVGLVTVGIRAVTVIQCVRTHDHSAGAVDPEFVVGVAGRRKLQQEVVAVAGVVIRVDQCRSVVLVKVDAGVNVAG